MSLFVYTNEIGKRLLLFEKFSKMGKITQPINIQTQYSIFADICKDKYSRKSPDFELLSQGKIFTFHRDYSFSAPQYLSRMRYVAYQKCDTERNVCRR